MAIRLTNKLNIEPFNCFIQLSNASKNIEVCEKLREELAPKKVNLSDEPRIAGALGACPTLLDTIDG